jgi:pimeloyl-ACP methyl ester carboxylesterase
MTLDDGRQLAYTRAGKRGARPVLFCHGTPGSRLFRPADPRVPAALGIDLVTVDRPGYGRSTRLPGRTLLDWPKDVAAMARKLSWDRFAVIGISGGGPYALACGARLPERVAAVGVVSGVAPFWPAALRGMLATTRRGFQLAYWAPGLLILAARQAARDPERFQARLRRELPECDRRTIERPDVAQVVAENAAEALRSDEMAREMVLLRNRWGFTLGDVQIPVLVWHGERDRNVPVAHGSSPRGDAAPLSRDVRAGGGPLPHLRPLGPDPLRCGGRSRAVMRR